MSMMAGGDLEANVVLTADNAQYDQAMTASAGQTDQLAKSIEGVGQSLSKIGKNAGKGLVGIAAADVAMIGTATAAWSSYESQVSRLNSQSAILGKTQTEQKRLMGDYEKSVQSMRKEYGTTTREAASLTETLSKITSTRQSRELKDLSKIFVDMSKATGENSEGLASSLTSLQRIMGTDINKKETRKYADQFTYMASQIDTTAGSLIELTAALAPTARQIGISQKEVAGFAAAFTRAGQDGRGVANIFTKIVGDISYATATGSPELEKYADLANMTRQAFTDLSGAEQVIRVLEGVQAKGSGAVTELNRLGLDGPRAMRQITAVLNERGGLRQAMGLADEAMDSDAAKKGAAAASEGLSDEWQRLREELKMTAENMATMLGPMVEGFVKGMEKMAEVVNKVSEGPLGTFAQVLATILAPLAGGTGALLLFSGALLKVAAGFALIRNSAAQGLREGAKGSGRITMLGDGTYGSEGVLGPRGQQIAAGGTWLQRGMYNAGQMVGMPLGMAGRGTVGAWRTGREAWNPDYKPGTRGPMSYVAGAVGFGIDTFVTPQFDQMRYKDPARRSTWLRQQAPWARAMDRIDLSRQMGAVASAESNLTGIRRAMIDTEKDPLLTSQQRIAQMESLSAAREEAKQRLNSARETERATREQISATKEQTNETKKSSQGFGRLTRSVVGLGWAEATSGFGAARAVGGRLMRSPVAAPLAGTLAAGGMATMGVESNAALFAALGLSFGGWGALAGGAMGMGLDVAQGGKKIDESISTLSSFNNSLTMAGTGFAGMDEQIKQTQSDLEKYRNEVAPGYKGWNADLKYTLRAVTSPIDTARGLKNKVEGWGWVGDGKSDVEEREEEAEKEAERSREAEDLARKLAEKYGYKIKGETRQAQLEDLDKFMSTYGGQMLSDAGYTFKDLTDALSGETAKIWGLQGLVTTQEDILGLTSGPNPRTADRMSRTAAGEVMFASRYGQAALNKEADVGLQFKAIDEIYETMREQGASNVEILKSAEEAQAASGVENSREYELMVAVAQKAQQNMSYQAPFMGRTDVYQQQASILQAIGSVDPGSREGQNTELRAAQQSFIEQTVAQGQYFQQLLLQQREFEVSMSRAAEDFGIQRERMDYQYNLGRARAQEDFHIQRTQQEYDYQLSRRRAEEDFDRQRDRSNRQYNRSMQRSRADFNRSRKRQEEDFQHSVMLMVEASAKQMYNIYERVQVQQTKSASWMLVNSRDQSQRMRTQTRNLDTLRGQGLSEDAIQQLGLTDSKNAQQLSRFVAEVAADPKLIKQFNRQVAERLRAASKLTKDESSQEWEEFQRSYELARKRASADFKRSVTRSHKDFERQMSQMEKDFRRSMNRQATDYETAQDRQASAFGRAMKRSAADYGVTVKQMTSDYNRQMTRAQEDVERMQTEITGSLTDLLEAATKKLGGTAGKQARKVLRTLKDLNLNATEEGISIMENLSEVFGFDYKAPKRKRGGGSTAQKMGSVPKDIYSAQGGVLPGYTPGNDVHHYTSASGPDLHLSGGEAVMVPEWVRAIGGPKAVMAMNKKARHGGMAFAMGGVTPAPGAWNRHDSGYHWARWAGDINVPGSGDYGNPVRAWKSGTVALAGWGGGDSYGNYIRVNHPGSNEQTLYAHLSKILVQAGDIVRAGQIIGNVGSTGNSTGPHLHFEIKGGTGPITIGGSATGGGLSGSGFSLKSILKDRYPGVEKAAESLMSGDMFPKKNWMSAQINEMAREKFKELGGNAKLKSDGTSHSDIPAAPGNLNDNQSIVRRAMLDAGFASSHWPALYQLVMHESGFRNTAQNPTSTAYGMFQFLDSTWAGVDGKKTSDPWLQAVYGMRYIKNRYKNPKGAWDFWQQNRWYGDGAVFNSPTTIGVGERGPEAVIPLDDKGADFMTTLIDRYSGGLEARGINTRGDVPVSVINQNTYHVDKSTTFSGPITVKANDPNQLVTQLQQRQRILALSNPGMGGKRI